MTKRATEGRYRAVRAATAPGDHLPSEGRRGIHIQIKHAVVDDPNPSFRGQRQRVAVNMRTDALEQEYAYDRISEAAYRAGRVYQAVLERAQIAPVGSAWSQGDRVDMALANELRIIRAIETVSEALEMLADTRTVVGVLGERVLELALAQGRTLSEVSCVLSGATPNKHSTAMYAWTFRQSLELLAAHWARRCAPR